MKKVLSFLVITSGLLVFVFYFGGYKYNWPSPQVPGFMEANISEARSKIQEMAPGVNFKYKVHEANKSYMLDRNGICTATESRPLDENGITMLKYRGAVYYHPVNTAQCGLIAYNIFISSGSYREEVIRNARKLIDMQDADGAFRYPFAWTYYLYGRDFPVGWTSAMAQAQAMSLFSRAYVITRDERYLFAGKKALDYLLTRTEDGGVMTTLKDLDPSLDDFIFFEEYVSFPANYTLNGYIYVLFGLHDWANLEVDDFFGAKKAKYFFKEGVITLKKILKYYDMGGATSYDLGYITFGKPSKVPANYHFLHVMQLNAIYEITGEAVFKETRDKWKSYIDIPYSFDVAAH